MVAACQQASEAPATARTSEPNGAIEASEVVNDGVIAASEVNCTYPVKRSDTAQDVLTRFGDDAARTDIHVGEGFFVPGIVLWGDDPTRKIEVVFAEENGSGPVAYLDFAGDAAWTVGGVAIGDSATRVQDINGEPFRFYGFEWDYGGRLIDMGSGALADLGGCTSKLDLNYSYEDVNLADDFIGDRAVSSDASGLPADKLTVWRLGISFEEQW